MSTPPVVTPDIAELSGRLQMATRRAESAEQEAQKLNARLKQEISLRVEMMSQLVDRNLPLPRRVVLNREPLRIESRDGQVRLVAPDGLVTVENGAAANRLIMELIEHCRAAFPAEFPEVF